MQHLVVIAKEEVVKSQFYKNVIELQANIFT